jgi:hypothetical protein
MEFIGKYPELPESYNNAEIIGFYGSVELISSAVLEYVGEKVEVSPGFNFYRHKNKVIAIFTTDQLQIDQQIFGLSKITQLTPSLIYCINKPPAKENWILSNSLAKLNINTYKDFKLPSSALECKITTLDVPEKSIPYKNTWAAIKCNPLPEIKTNELKKLEINLLEKLEKISKSDINESVITKLISEHQESMKSINIPYIDTNTLRKKMMEFMIHIISCKESNLEILIENLTKLILEKKVKTTVITNWMTQKDFGGELEKFQNSLRQQTSVDAELVIELVSSSIKSFVDEDQMSLLNSNCIKACQDYLKIMNQDIKKESASVKDYLDSLRYPKQYLEIDLKFVELTINQEPVWKDCNPIKMFVEKYYSLEQIIKHDQYCIIMLKTTDLPERYELVFSSSKIRFELIKSFKHKVVIADGSTLDNIIIINNADKTITKIDSLKNMQKPSDIYNEKVKIINSAVYLSEFKCLLFYNQDNKVFSYNFSKSVLKKIKLGVGAFDITISDNKKLIGIKTPGRIVIYTLKFEEVYSFESNCDHYSLTVSENLNLILCEKTQTRVVTFYNSIKKQVYENLPKKIYPDIDFLYRFRVDTLNKVYLHTNKPKSFENIFSYTTDMNKLFPPIDFYKFNQDIPSFIPANIRGILYTNIFKKICEAKDSNIIPYVQDTRYYSLLLYEKPDYYKQIYDSINFDAFGELLAGIPEIKVIGCIGDKDTPKFLCKIFGSHVYQNLDAGVWLYLNNTLGQYYLCIFGLNSKNDIESVKITAFILSISDIFIIHCDHYQKKYFDIITCAKKRLIGSKLFKGKVHVYTTSNNILDFKAIQNELKFDLAKFSYNENSQDEEIKYLMHEYSKIPFRWSGSEVIEYMKHIIVQLFTDDDYPLDTRLSFLNTEVAIKKKVLSNQGWFIITSYHLNVSSRPTRCKAKCPGCSRYCILPFQHPNKHLLPAHSLLTNKFMIVNFENTEYTCDMYCNSNKNHTHIEPCIGICYSSKEGRKHLKIHKNFDYTKNKSEADKVDCKLWWARRNWEI